LQDKLKNNKISRKYHNPFNKKLLLSDSKNRRYKNLNNPSTWVSCSSKLKSIKKRKALPKTKVSLKSSNETETCTKSNFKDQKRTIRKYTKKSSINKKFLSKNKTNFSVRRRKYKNSISKSPP
jgi:hypothetical protein